MRFHPATSALRAGLLIMLFEASAAKPYGNYGFYSPYPPPANQVLYEFSPLEETHRAHSQSRETRDLTWKDDLDAFLDGTKEPSCKELRQMWRMAREIQQRALETNEIPQELHPFLTFSPLDEPAVPKAAQGKKHHHKSASSSSSPSDLSKEIEVPPPHNRFATKAKADRRRMSNPPSTVGKDSSYVYGVVKTHQPPASSPGLHVRDPAKEIYGLLREREPEKPSKDNAAVYGEPSSAEGNPASPSYLDLVQKELFGESSSEKDTSDSPSYGVVRYSEPSSSSSAFDQVRAMVAAERGRMDKEGEEGEEEKEDEEEESPFELIRKNLMNTRLTSQSSVAARLGRTKSLRRKNSKKRRRNVREIARDLEKHLAYERLLENRRRTLAAMEEERKRQAIARAQRRRAIVEAERKRKLRARKKLQRKKERRERRRLEKLRRRNQMRSLRKQQDKLHQ